MELRPLLVNIEELAKLLGVDKKWIYERTSEKSRHKALRRGEPILPKYKLGKYVKFKLSEVESWLENFRE